MEIEPWPRFFAAHVRLFFFGIGFTACWGSYPKRGRLERKKMLSGCCKNCPHKIVGPVAAKPLGEDGYTPKTPQF